jgi:PST family polysaccharide transporter
VFFVAIIITRFLNGFICNLLAYYELRNELNPYISTPIRILEEEKKSIFGFIFGNSVGNSLKTVISQGDVLLLGVLSNPAQVGFYSVAKKLAYSILTLTDPLTQSIYPQLSKLIAERRFREIRRMLFKITGIAMIPGIVFLALTYFLNKWIIVTVYGIEYAPASDAFYYFLIGAVLGAATFWTLPLVQSLGIVTVRIKIYVMTIFLGSLLAYLLVPAMQSAGMSLALLVTNILNMVIFIYVADQRLKASIRLHEEAV